jgi:ATP-dependent protease Clp ATPase subunit
VHNVTHEVRGDKLVVTIDISQSSINAAPPSSSGKTHLVATTGGAVSVPCKYAGPTYAINVMAKKGAA